MLNKIKDKFLFNYELFAAARKSEKRILWLPVHPAIQMQFRLLKQTLKFRAPHSTTTYLIYKS
jgi:hypothetical protein